MATVLQAGSSLKRSISLPMLTLYGLGTIIGAGIYVLVGEIAGHAGVFVQLPEWWVVVTLTLLLGDIAAWGIKQSAWSAAIMTVLSVLGLVWVLVVAFSDIDFGTIDLDDFVPPLDTAVWTSPRPDGVSVIPIAWPAIGLLLTLGLILLRALSIV